MKTLQGYSEPIKHFHSLDALRGIAALSVVLWHWKFFFALENKNNFFQKEDMPFYEYFSIAYEEGDIAVDLFFCLSGFIFCWLYATTISERKISAYNFFVLRFSRLYPLHIFALIIILLNQNWFYSNHGTYLITQHNDIYHFLLNLMFASSWSVEEGLSFNVPTWSVSVEVLLYGVFWLCCRVLTHERTKVIFWLICTLAGFFLVSKYYMPVGRGLGSFFEGALCFLLFKKIQERKRLVIMSTVFIPLITIITWLLIVLFQLYDWHPNEWYLIEIKQHAVIKALLPLTILSCALLESNTMLTKQMVRYFAWIGNISYASYLLHFPLQAIFINTVNMLNIPIEVFLSTWMMVVFFSVLILISLCSYHFYELPVQSYLRSRLIKN